MSPLETGAHRGCSAQPSSPHGGPGSLRTAASPRRPRSLSPKCLRVRRLLGRPVDTDPPWCSPARCLREGASSADLFSKPWTHLFNVSQGKFGLFLPPVMVACCCGAARGPDGASCARMRRRCRVLIIPVAQDPTSDLYVALPSEFFYRKKEGNMFVSLRLELLGKMFMNG